MNKPNAKNQGLLGVFIAGLLMAGLGAFAGLIFLAAYPIQGFANQQELDRHLKKLEEKEVSYINPSAVYYIEGPDRSSRNWRAVREEILAGDKQSINLPAGAINNWLSANFQIGSIEDDSKSGIMITPGMPKISSLKSGEVYFSMPMEWKVYGTSYNRTYVAIGEFVGTKFVLNQIQINGAGVPVPVVGQMLHDRFVSIFSNTEEFQLLASALANVQSVEVGDNGFLLKL